MLMRRSCVSAASFSFSFTVEHTSKRSAARAGVMHTQHGDVLTPCYVPVATNGTLKGVDHGEVEVPLMFMNTLHIELITGCETIRQAGGIHAFVNRNAPIITDSGGFQVFSLGQTGDLSFGGNGNAKELKRSRDASSYKGKDASEREALLERCTEERGAVFKSYVDGSRHTLTPEKTVDLQRALGSDIMLPLDHLSGHMATKQEAEQSFHLSHVWMERSLRHHLDQPATGQAMFGICHGGVDLEMRHKSASFLMERDFDGFAIGGSLGDGLDSCETIVRAMAPKLGCSARPVHLLGIADAHSIPRFVQHGVDSFDSCYATRLARHGTLLCRGRPDGLSRIKVKQTKHKSDYEPPDWDLAERTGDHRSLAYLHHLVRANEPTAVTLMTRHNVLFLQRQIGELRAAILNDEI